MSRARDISKLLTGDLTLSGTIDGRDLATDGTKLDAIEANAKDDQTITAGTGLAGGGTGDVTLSLDTAGAGAATYGSTDDGTKIDTITLDAYGRVTAVATGTAGTGTVTSVATGGGLTGGTITGSGTISHSDTSSQSSVNNSGLTFIQDVTLDTYGHVTGLTSATASGGKVAQIQETRKTNTFSTTVGNAGTTLMSRSITPSSTSSKVLITVSVGCVSSDVGTAGQDSSICYIQRGSTDVIEGDASGSRRRSAFVMLMNNTARGQGGLSYTVLDSPSTTSSVTYNFKVTGDEGTATFINRTDNDQNADRTYSARTACTMQCIEITA